MAELPVEKLQVEYEYGTKDNITINANSSTNIPITFSKPFSAIPQVIANISRAYGSVEVMNNLAINVVAVSTTAASITVYNNNSSDIGAVSVRWLAIA